MIEQGIKDKVFGIISYCDTPQKLDVLVKNVEIIKEKYPNYKIALQANYPLPEGVQRMVDLYVYQDLNFTGDDKWIYYWNILPYFKKKFFYTFLDTGFSVFQQIKALTKYLIEYKQVLLINYDTSVEEIRIEDYNKDYDLITHLFPEGNAYSLIIMAYNPKIFYDKVAKYFTYENWMLPKRVDQLNEQRFYDMVHESDIKCFVHNYKISDKVSNMPDYLEPYGTGCDKPNGPSNEFFTTYLVYYSNNILEVYLWGLLKDIRVIEIKIENASFTLFNNNQMNAFESSVEYISKNTEITHINILKINDILVNIPLKFKNGYSTRPIEF